MRNPFKRNLNPLPDASKALFSVYPLPDAENVSHPYTEVVGLLSSVAIARAGIEYTVYIKRGGFHIELRKKALEDPQGRNLEELTTSDGRSALYTAFSVGNIAYYALLPPDNPQKQGDRHYKYYKKVLELGCRGLSVVAQQYVETGTVPPLQSKLPLDALHEARALIECME